MKNLTLNQLEVINGGTFCKGFGAAAAVYEVGVVANLWNPVGWGGQAVLAGVGLYCALS